MEPCRERKLIHIDCAPSDISGDYRRTSSCWATSPPTLEALTGRDQVRPSPAQADLLAELRRAHDGLGAEASRHAGTPIHPLQLVHALQGLLDGGATLCCDIGSFHIWIARHLVAHRPRQIMFSNGQQTLGVALPWAIAACLANPGGKVISVSGDGGFLFSAVELETAVRLNALRESRMDRRHLNMGGIKTVRPTAETPQCHLAQSTGKFAESWAREGLSTGSGGVRPDCARRGMPAWC